MGTEAIWIPLLLSAAGVGVNMYNQNQLQNKQEDTIVSGIQQQKKRQGEINNQTQELLSKFQGSNPEQDKARLLAAYTQQLGKNRPMANAGLTEIAGASGDYKAGTQDAALGIADYGSMLSSLMSRVDAPQYQRQREGVMMGDYGIDLDRVKRASQGDAFINEMRLKSLHSNPWLSALSSALSGAGAAAGTGNGSILDIFSGGTPTDFGIPLPGSGRLPGF